MREQQEGHEVSVFSDPYKAELDAFRVNTWGGALSLSSDARHYVLYATSFLAP